MSKTTYVETVFSRALNLMDLAKDSSGEGFGRNLHTDEKEQIASWALIVALTDIRDELMKLQRES